MEEVSAPNIRILNLRLPCGKLIDNISYEMLEKFDRCYGGIPIDEWICNFCPYSSRVVIDYDLTIAVCQAYRKYKIKGWQGWP